MVIVVCHNQLMMVKKLRQVLSNSLNQENVIASFARNIRIINKENKQKKNKNSISDLCALYYHIHVDVFVFEKQIHKRNDD